MRVSAPVAIGPVTAVTLTADTGDAINAWLADNGFVIPAADQALVADYAGPGRYFIAIRRSDTAATQAPSSVGVHFTLAGDQRALPMRFARLGAAPTVAFTVFVAAYTVAAPADPFAALTINDLDVGTLNTTGYADAVSKAVSAHGNHAFVLEGSWSVPTVPGGIGPSLAPFMNARQTLTRMSTRVDASTLDADVAFDGIYSGSVPNQRYTQRTSRRHPHAAFAFAALAFTAVIRRRPRRSSRRARRAYFIRLRFLTVLGSLDSDGGGCLFRRRASLLLQRAAVVGRVGVGGPRLQRAGVVGIRDAVLVGVDQRAAGPLRIGRRPGRRHRAGIVRVGHVVAVLVVLRAAGLERIGVLALRDVLADVLVVTDAVAIGCREPRGDRRRRAADPFRSWRPPPRGRSGT